MLRARAFACLRPQELVPVQRTNVLSTRGSAAKMTTRAASFSGDWAHWDVFVCVFFLFSHPELSSLVLRACVVFTCVCTEPEPHRWDGWMHKFDLKLVVNYWLAGDGARVLYCVSVCLRCRGWTGIAAAIASSLHVTSPSLSQVSSRARVAKCVCCA